MSNEALSLVAKADIHPSGRKFVLMALADYADEEWSCFPSIQHLERYTAQGDKTIRDHLDALEAGGIITRTRQRRDDGTLGRYRYVIQRRNLPVAKSASGEKPPIPAADFAAHKPPIEPSLARAPAKRPLAELQRPKKSKATDVRRVSKELEPELWRRCCEASGHPSTMTGQDGAWAFDVALVAQMEAA